MLRTFEGNKSFRRKKNCDCSQYIQKPSNDRTTKIAELIKNSILNTIVRRDLECIKCRLAIAY